MNSITLMGRLTADPELSYTPNSVPVCKFNIAVPRPHVKNTTDFIRCVAWRNTAEFVDTYFKKGKMIAVTGILTSKSWKDKQGNNRMANEVLVELVDFCGDKVTEPKPAASEQAPDPDIPDSFQSAEDDIPFA